MKEFNKNIFAAGAFLAGITIAIGAFGAHGLKDLVDESALLTFETGVRYQMYHAIAILILAFIPLVDLKIKKTVFWLFVVGILLFSCSIYLLSLNVLLPFDAAKIGFITPIGGLCFILGWFWLGFKIMSLRKR